MLLKFRLAKTDDIEVILQMMKTFYEIDHYPFDYQQSLENLNQFISNDNFGKLWLLEENHKVIGYLVFSFSFSFEFGGRDAFIDEFFILESCRGRGLGRKMLDFSLKQAKDLDIKAVHLEVEKHNIRGNRLYRNYDFQEHDRYMMTKRIY
ncbi:MAG: GNAT family N-acetyltransferase [Flammeovirgaceae bacterium]|nr:GNAT family N-acetyltransferase [Flammeovirgaceae bacterium]